MEAEYIALSEVVKEVMYMWRLLTHMDGRNYADDPTCVNFDNQSAVRFNKDSIYNPRSKHVDIRFHFTKEAQEDGEVIVQHIPTDKNPADLLTKALLRIKTSKCKDTLNLINQKGG